MANAKEPVWDPYLKGIGQIMLQANPWTGLLFIIGILVNSPIMALGAVVATIVGTVTAKLLKYDRTEIDNGLYGFNAALIGVAFINFFQATVLVWVAIVLLSALTTVMMNYCLRNKIPIFTFPFILLTWIGLFVFHSVMPVPEPVDVPLELVDDDFSLMFHGLGFGEVIFQGSLLSGIIFFIAVYISSPNAALYGIAGSLFGVIAAILLKERIGDVKMGMFSFNAVLCAITFSGLRKRDGLYVLLAVILSGIIEDAMLRNALSVLTFPFVLATWLVLIIRDVLVKRFISPNWV
jgi:urea transporter